MTSPIGRAPGPAPLPHVSDPSQADRLRGDIAQQARDNPSLYALEVGVVNNLLRRGGFSISPASHQSVMDNLRQVREGRITESTAHLREAGTFARDAFESVRQGRYRQAAMETVGVALNTGAAVVTAPHVGLQRAREMGRELSQRLGGDRP